MNQAVNLRVLERAIETELESGELDGAVGQEALNTIFRAARTHNGWLDRPVPEALLRQAVDLAKMGPTAANSSPLRIVFVSTPQAKERLRPALNPGNVEKTMAAPVTAILGHDHTFYDQLPKLFPHADARSWFAGNEAFAAATARHSGTLQEAYFILALRAVGLDAGPLNGFDPAAVDAAFFAGTAVRSSLVVNTGFGDHGKLFPRSPRLDFEEIASFA